MTMTDNPLISIIMNCYNGEKFLQEALDSVINQIAGGLISEKGAKINSSRKTEINYKQLEHYVFNQKSIFVEFNQICVKKRHIWV